MSTGTDASAPTGVTLRSCSTRSSRACMPSGKSRFRRGTACRRGPAGLADRAFAPRAGEGAAAVAEELRFDQVLGDRAQLARRTGRRRAGRCYGTRARRVLCDARLALDQQRMSLPSTLRARTSASWSGVAGREAGERESCRPVRGAAVFDGDVARADPVAAIFAGVAVLRLRCRRGQLHRRVAMPMHLHVHRVAAPQFELRQRVAGARGAFEKLTETDPERFVSGSAPHISAGRLRQSRATGSHDHVKRRRRARAVPPAACRLIPGASGRRRGSFLEKAIRTALFEELHRQATSPACGVAAHGPAPEMSNTPTTLPSASKIGAALQVRKPLRSR